MKDAKRFWIWKGRGSTSALLALSCAVRGAAAGPTPEDGRHGKGPGGKYSQSGAGRPAVDFSPPAAQEAEQFRCAAGFDGSYYRIFFVCCFLSFTYFIEYAIAYNINHIIITSSYSV